MESLNSLCQGRMGISDQLLLRQLNTSILSFRRKPESRWVLGAGSSPA